MTTPRVWRVNDPVVLKHDPKFKGKVVGSVPLEADRGNEILYQVQITGYSDAAVLFPADALITEDEAKKLAKETQTIEI